MILPSPSPLLRKKAERDRTLILSQLQRVPKKKKKKKKRNQEWENSVFWPYCCFILDSARGIWSEGRGWGGGGCLLLQDCSQDPEIHDCFAAQCEKWWTNDISNVCFCFLKEHVTNLHIESTCVNFLRDKPLSWNKTLFLESLQQRQSKDRGIDQLREVLTCLYKFREGRLYFQS